MTVSAAPVSAQSVGILAGSGDLPAMLVEACRAGGREPFVVAFNGFTDPGLVTGTRHAWVDIAAVGKTFQLLRQAGCQAVVLAGKMRRPALSTLRPDARGLLVLAKVAAAGGDDAVLRVLVKELEGEGFRVLGVEAVEGTDALLRRCAELRREGQAGVLVKLKKVGQDRRVDLPVIGPDTIAAVRAAGLAGIAIEAGGTLVVRRAEVIAAANAAGQFVYGLSAAELV